MTHVTMPQLGETVAEGTVTSWFKQVGEPVAVGDLLFEVTTDKVDTEVPSTAAGVLREILVPEGETVPVGTALAVVGDADAGPTATEAPAAATGAPPGRPDQAPAPQTLAPPVVPPSSGGAGFQPNTRHRASPLVRRLLRERGLSEQEVTGSGPGGRVLRTDVAALDTQPAAEPVAEPVAELASRSRSRPRSRPPPYPMTSTWCRSPRYAGGPPSTWSARRPRRRTRSWPSRSTSAPWTSPAARCRASR